MHAIKLLVYKSGGCLERARFVCRVEAYHEAHIEHKTEAEYLATPCVACQTLLAKKTVKQTEVVTLEDVDPLLLARKYAIWVRGFEAYDGHVPTSGNYVRTIDHNCKITVTEELGRTGVGDLEISLQRNPKTGRLDVTFGGNLAREVVVHGLGASGEN